MTKIIDRALAKHSSAVGELNKLRDKRDQAIAALIRAQSRFDSAVKAVSRSQKRLDKVREEERQAKLARKLDKQKNIEETPDIGTVLGV